MIYCLNCGKGIPDQSKFCTFCGTPTAQVDPQNPTTAVPSASQPFAPTPAEQPPVTPTPPPQQQYVPPQQQYVPPQQQYANPNYQANQQYTNPPAQQFVRPQPVTTKNEFYKNVGFWGAVFLVAGFFLPYANNGASFYYLVSEGVTVQPSLYLLLIFPVSAAIVILQGLTGVFPKILVAIFKILPILWLIIIVIASSNSNLDFSSLGNDVGTILGNIGVGLYLTVAGALLILFFKTTKQKI